MARPTIYNEEVAERFFVALSTSTTKGVRTLCRENEDFPNEDTIYTWAKENKSFSERLENARREQLWHTVWSVVEEAGEHSYYIDGEGNKRIDPASVALAKNKAGAIQWAASKIFRTKWGSQEETDKLKEDNQKLLEIASKMMDKFKSDV